MTGIPKCPHGCDAPQEAGTTFYEPRRIPTHRDKRGGLVLGRYANVLMRRWACTKCHKAYAVDEPKKKLTTATKGKKRGKKPKQRKKRTANATSG